MLRREPRLLDREGTLSGPTHAVFGVYGGVVAEHSGRKLHHYPGQYKGYGRQFYLFDKKFYSTDLDLSHGDVLALLLEAENKVHLKVARAKALIEQVKVIESPRRKSIPDDVKVLVWQRDKGVCVNCGSNRNLEFDHIIPVVMGGADTARNLQLLCETCNRSKGGHLV